MVSVGIYIKWIQLRYRRTNWLSTGVELKLTYTFFYITAHLPISSYLSNKFNNLQKVNHLLNCFFKNQESNALIPIYNTPPKLGKV